MLSGIIASCKNWKRAPYLSNFPSWHKCRALRISASHSLSTQATNWGRDRYPICGAFGTMSSRLQGYRIARYSPDPLQDQMFFPFLTLFLCPCIFLRGLAVDGSALFIFSFPGPVLFFIAKRSKSNSPNAASREIPVVFHLHQGRPLINCILGKFSPRREVGGAKQKLGLQRFWTAETARFSHFYAFSSQRRFLCIG